MLHNAASCKTCLNPHRGGVILSVVFSTAWIGSITCLTVTKGMTFPLIVYAGPLPCWIMFFVVGVKIGSDKNRSYSLFGPSLLLLSGYLLSVISSHYLYTTYHTGAGIKPTAFIYALGAILVLFNEKVEKTLNPDSRIYKSIVWIGDMSFAIYLSHMYVLTFLVSKFHVDNWCLKAVLALTFTILLITIIKKTVPTKLHHYLGI